MLTIQPEERKKGVLGDSSFCATRGRFDSRRTADPISSLLTPPFQRRASDEEHKTSLGRRRHRSMHLVRAVGGARTRRGSGLPEAPKILATKTRRTCIFPPTFLLRGIVSRGSTRSGPIGRNRAPHRSRPRGGVKPRERSLPDVRHSK